MPEETRIVIKGGRTEDTVISSFPGAAQAAPWGGLVPLRFFLYAPVEKKQKWANQCHSDKDDGKRTGTETGSGLFFC